VPKPACAQEAKPVSVWIVFERTSYAMSLNSAKPDSGSSQPADRNRQPVQGQMAALCAVMKEAR
jgi:hypothetical protein